MIRIKNWHRFQHFKDRRPLWIKLYIDLLDDPEYHKLDPLAAKYLPLIWLVGSLNQGTLPETEKLSFRLRITEKQAESVLSKLGHWLEQDDINSISYGYQDDALEKRREEERREDKEEKKKFLDFVYLTEEEHRKLIERFGEAEVQAKIEGLNTGIGSKGYKYKSHYFTILNWSRKDPKPITPPAPAKSKALCAYEGCTRLGIVGQGRRFFCHEHDPDKL